MSRQERSESGEQLTCLCSSRTNIESSKTVKRLRAPSATALDAPQSPSSPPTSSKKAALCTYISSEPSRTRHHGRTTTSVVPADPAVTRTHSQDLQLADANQSRSFRKLIASVLCCNLRHPWRRRSLSRSVGVMSNGTTAVPPYTMHRIWVMLGEFL